MILETNDTIKEYWEEVKHLYPNIPYQQFQTICKNPFRFFKAKMETDEMPEIHIKYFGKFIVFSTKIKRLIKKLETRKKFLLDNKKKFDPERHDIIRAELDRMLIKIEENEAIPKPERRINGKKKRK